jgi:hypothetical protein
MHPPTRTGRLKILELNQQCRLVPGQLPSPVSAFMILFLLVGLLLVITPFVRPS